jgi:hypothetical protein
LTVLIHFFPWNRYFIRKFQMPKSNCQLKNVKIQMSNKNRTTSALKFVIGHYHLFEL